MGIRRVTSSSPCLILVMRVKSSQVLHMHARETKDTSNNRTAFSLPTQFPFSGGGVQRWSVSAWLVFSGKRGALAGMLEAYVGLRGGCQVELVGQGLPDIRVVGPMVGASLLDLTSIQVDEGLGSSLYKRSVLHAQSFILAILFEETFLEMPDECTAVLFMQLRTLDLAAHPANRALEGGNQAVTSLKDNKLIVHRGSLIGLRLALSLWTEVIQKSRLTTGRTSLLRKCEPPFTLSIMTILQMESLSAHT
eukprot:1140946-Pelagomonas_calceolata.AAC.1